MFNSAGHRGTRSYRFSYYCAGAAGAALFPSLPALRRRSRACCYCCTCCAWCCRGRVARWWRRRLQIQSGERRRHDHIIILVSVRTSRSRSRWCLAAVGRWRSRPRRSSRRSAGFPVHVFGGRPLRLVSYVPRFWALLRKCVRTTGPPKQTTNKKYRGVFTANFRRADVERSPERWRDTGRQGTGDRSTVMKYQAL